MFYDRELLVSEGLLERSLVGYRISQKGLELLSKWRKAPFDAGRFWYAPAQAQELIAMELEGLKMKSDEIMSYLSRHREQDVGS